MTTMREWYECRSLNDVLAFQQRWVQSAVEHYVDQGNRIMETCRLAAADLTKQLSLRPKRRRLRPNVSPPPIGRQSSI